jgi:hypothetical protein
MNDYQKYLDRLDHLISMEVVPKTAIFDYFTEHIDKFGDEPLKVEPLIWYLQTAFYSDITFSIFRLFDKKGDGNIYDFTERAKAQLSTIAWQTPLTAADIARHESQLNIVGPIVENLRKRRNKFFGHYDKKFFYEPEKVNVDFPFSNEDAKILVRVLQSIVADHKTAFSGSSSISIDGFVYAAAENMYEKLRAAARRD